MKNSKILWIFLIGIVITVFIAFNYQGGKETVPLSEIFPDEDMYPVEIEIVENTSANEEAPRIIKVKEEEVKSVPLTVAVELESVNEEIQKIPEKIVVEVSQVSEANEVKTSSKIPFTIQIASFKDRNRAEKAIKALESNEHKGYIIARDLGVKGTWYRVYVGQFQIKSEADAFLSTLVKDYPSSFVISPK